MSRNGNTSFGYLNSKYCPIESLNREKSGYLNDAGIVTFALKGKVLEIVKEKVISELLRSPSLRNAVSLLYVMN